MALGVTLTVALGPSRFDLPTECGGGDAVVGGEVAVVAGREDWTDASSLTAAVLFPWSTSSSPFSFSSSSSGSNDSLLFVTGLRSCFFFFLDKDVAETLYFVFISLASVHGMRWSFFFHAISSNLPVTARSTAGGMKAS
jgi:hypothetical protein